MDQQGILLFVGAAILIAIVNIVLLLVNVNPTLILVVSFVLEAPVVLYLMRRYRGMNVGKRK